MAGPAYRAIAVPAAPNCRRVMWRMNELLLHGGASQRTAQMQRRRRRLEQLRLPHQRGSVVPAPIALARLLRVVLVAGGLLVERLLDLSRWRVRRPLHGVLRLAHS